MHARSSASITGNKLARWHKFKILALFWHGRIYKNQGYPKISNCHRPGALHTEFWIYLPSHPSYRALKVINVLKAKNFQPMFLGGFKTVDY